MQDCSIGNSTISIEWSTANHSAWNPFLNCSLSKCTSLPSNNSYSCPPLAMSCFDYRMANGTRYCAPSALCSLVEPCDINGTCSSGLSVCITNACCGIPALCLPLEWTSLCSPVGKMLFQSLLNNRTYDNKQSIA